MCTPYRKALRDIKMCGFFKVVHCKFIEMWAENNSDIISCSGFNPSSAKKKTHSPQHRPTVEIALASLKVQLGKEKRALRKK